MTHMRNRYSEYDPDDYGIAIDPEEDQTHQEHEAECNINNIMAKYQRTGTIDHIAKYSPIYQDVQAIDYQSALNTIANSEAMFQDLPSQLRKHFDNDPAKFLEFVDRDGQDGVYDLLTKLGVAYGEGSRYEPPTPPPAPPEPVTDPVDNDTP